MAHYVVIQSNKNLDYFPDNKPFRFRTYLQSALNLKGNWKVALVDIFVLENSVKSKQNLYVHCDICGESIVDGEKDNLLRMVKFQKLGNWSQSFNPPFYVPVNTSETRELEILIRDSQGELASFLKKPVTVTLHFRAYPFYT